MTTYEVTLDVHASLIQDLDDYMIDEHIPDVLATGCFAAATYNRDGVRRRTVYEADDRGSLDRYIAEHAKGLRDHFAERFPSGVSVTREIWDAVVRFETPE